jgi:hypothetical protein
VDDDYDVNDREVTTNRPDTILKNKEDKTIY